MTTSRRSVRRRLAWAAPVATAGLIAAAVALPGSASAGVPKLPVLSPAALLAAVQTSQVQQLSGQVVETARLGLPSLPGSVNSAALSWQTLVTGSHTANIAIDGPERQRLGLVGTLAESDVIHNGRDLWTYASDTRKVTHRVLPAPAAEQRSSTPDPADPKSATPLGVANELLAAITPTTGVSMDPNTRVAGQDAYVLVLTPHQAGSTIRKVVIAVDARRHLPLRVQVFGQGTGKPAFETGFTSIHYTRPSASTFQFHAPKGSTVTTPATPGSDTADSPGTAASHPSAAPKVLGTGWTSVVEITGAQDALGGLSSQSGQDKSGGGSADLLNRLLTAQPNGDRLLKTALLNVLLTADGRVFAGAVQPSVLQQAAAAKS